VEALGVRPGRDDHREPRFGPIAPDFVAELMARRRELDVLPDDQPYGLMLDFLQTVLENVNRCRRAVLLDKEDAARMDDEGIAASERIRDVMRGLRKQNAAAHVGDAAFPANWTPPALAP
jgi:hypothetical protein